MLALKANRKAAELKATPIWADKSAMLDLYSAREFAEEFFGVEIHVDHIVPLQSKRVCGLHVEDNLQLLPELAYRFVQGNIAKGNRYWPDMP